MPFEEVDGAEAVQHLGLAGGLAGLAPDLQRLAQERQRVVGPAEIFVEERRQIDERVAQPGLVADLALQAQGFLVAALGVLRLPELLLHLRDLAQAVRHPFLVAQPALDLERVVVVAQGFVGLIEPLVGDAHRLQDVAARLVVLELSGDRERAREVLQRALRVAALDLDAAERQQAFDVLRVQRNDAFEVRLRLIEPAILLVQRAQVVLQRGVVRRGLGEVLVGLERALGVVRDQEVVRLDAGTSPAAAAPCARDVAFLSAAADSLSNPSVW